MTGLAGDSVGPDPSKVAADRRTFPAAMQVAVVLASAASLGLAARMLPVDGKDPTLPLVGGAVAAALAVGGLRSVSIRVAVRWMCVVGGLLVVRFGSTSTDDAVGGGIMLGWVLSTVTALVLVSRAAIGLQRAALSHPSRRRVALPVARTVVVVVCLIAAGGIGLGPSAAAGFSTGDRIGDRPAPNDGSPGSALAATERLDMTRRPRLTDAVVLTIRADRIGFVRSQTFDEWDGQAWTRTQRGLRSVPSNGAIVPDEFDLAATSGTPLRQEFRLAAPFATSLPAAPSAVRVTVPTPLAQWDDGSVATAQPLGRGAVYTVESRQRTDLTPDLMRGTADATVPPAVLERYAAAPVATGRVERLAREITAGADTPYDKAMAIEAWLDANTEYSLDAPVAPRGADVVDDFLFESQVGWCEQIASSFTVLLRLSGVPARLATGYVPEGRDAVTRSFVVRERDAHAWTEVWFPEVGWVQFDPTAGVPLGTPVDGESVGSLIVRYSSWALLAIAVLVAFAAPVAGGVGRLAAWLRSRSWRRRDRRATAAGWAAETEVVLERIGHRSGRPRAPAETATAFARDLGAVTGEPRLAEVGATVDRARFSPDPPGDAERADARELLDALLGSGLSSPARR